MKCCALRGAALVLAWIGFVAPGRAQLTVTPYTDAVGLASAVLAFPGVTINSALYNGAPVAVGFFGGGTSEGVLPVGSGLVITSGIATGVIGPNNSTSFSGFDAQPGYAPLDAMVGGGTFDAAVLTITFTPNTTGLLSLQYIFGSEEYPEYVDTEYNDPFAFFLNGVNTALLPGTSTAVAIDSVNANQNPQYYYDNTGGGLDTQLDGLVGRNPGSYLFASGLVMGGVTNTLTIAVADRGDSDLDSALFVARGTLTPVTLASVPESSTYGFAAVALLGSLIALRARKAQSSWRRTETA